MVLGGLVLELEQGLAPVLELEPVLGLEQGLAPVLGLEMAPELALAPDSQ
jgi:hypothetical protein